MSPRSTTSGASDDEPAFFRSRGGGPVDSDRRGGIAGALPGYRLTARLNVVASLATFLSALSLFVIDRPQPGPYVLIDDLNIVFIVLNTFVGFTTSIFSASYICARTQDRPADPGVSAFLPRDVSDHDVRHEPRLRVEQYRPDVGRDGNRHPDHRADGRHLSHPCRAGSGLEIFHPRQRRHRVRPVRHHPGLHGGSVRWSAKARTA